MDLEAKKPMVKDGIFRIMSMTKPVIGVADSDDDGGRQGPAAGSGLEVHARVEGHDRRDAAAGSTGRARRRVRRRRAGRRHPSRATTPCRSSARSQIRDLLTHTSGVVSGTISNFATRAVAAGPKDTLADYIPRLGKVPLEFQPGTRWAYSAAAGFDVLSRIVEVASGMPIDQFVKQRIFDPLEMKDTTYIVRRPATRGS